MGIDLVPKVNIHDMIIREREFIKFDEPPTRPDIQINDGSVEDGCITYGMHKILKFNVDCRNEGDEDLHIGNPFDRDDIFEDSIVHRRIFKEPFFKYQVKNERIQYVTYKRPWCLSDSEGNCSDQRIRVGKSDTYKKDHTCQFILIDGIENGGYDFAATVNYSTIQRKLRNNTDGFIIQEDDYNNNTITIPIKVNGNIITQG
jgi:hypothetical protein